MPTVRSIPQRRGPSTVNVVVLAVVTCWPAALPGQDPGLAVSVPAADQVTVRADTFTNSSGSRRQFDVYRPIGDHPSLPIAVFANGSGPVLRTWRSYIEWARLVTSRGFAGVLYEGPSLDPAKTMAENINASIADLDSVLATLARRGGSHDIDASRVVIWAGSAQTFTGTPVALDGERPAIRGYVLYYGAGTTQSPRLDVPVFIARAGFDSPALNRSLDSLSRQLVSAGVAVTLANYPGGRHGFDVVDTTAMTQRIVSQTLDFMEAAVDTSLRRSLIVATPEVRAMSAFVAERWVEAVRLYEELAARNPVNAAIHWRLGLAQLANDQPAEALASLTRARELGQGGARDIGLPAARAALRAKQTDKAAEWLLWATRSFPPLRNQVAADAELAPLLNHPLLRGGNR